MGLASEGRQEVILVSVVVADSGRAEPGGDRPSPVGEEQAHHEDRQAPAVAGL
jgi:hypothetical protein